MRTAARKPEAILFQQWDGNEGSANELMEYLAADGVGAKFIPGFNQLIGNMFVPVTPVLAFTGYNLRPGDYLVRRELGTWEPMSPTHFLNNYDPQ